MTPGKHQEPWRVPALRWSQIDRGGRAKVHTGYDVALCAGQRERGVSSGKCCLPTRGNDGMTSMQSETLTQKPFSVKCLEVAL